MEGADNYNIFPAEMEADDHIFFHGTAASTLPSILAGGFKPMGKLSSVSFARNSGLALSYACKARSPAEPEGCVIAVRFDGTKKAGIAPESFGLLVYKFDPQPVILLYTIIPAGYVFA